MKTFLRKKMNIINKNIEKSLHLLIMKFPFFSHWQPTTKMNSSKTILKVKKDLNLNPSQKKALKIKNFKGSSYQGKGKVNKDARWFNHPRKDVPSGREGK